MRSCASRRRASSRCMLLHTARSVCARPARRAHPCPRPPPSSSCRQAGWTPAGAGQRWRQALHASASAGAAAACMSAGAPDVASIQHARCKQRLLCLVQWPLTSKNSSNDGLRHLNTVLELRHGATGAEAQRQGRGQRQGQRGRRQAMHAARRAPPAGNAHMRHAGRQAGGRRNAAARQRPLTGTQSARRWARRW